MIAFDTNMLVRAAVAGHPEQVAVVRQLMAGHTVFVSRTVLLEAEWVLRSRYKKNRQELFSFFVALLEAQNAELESAPAVSHALDWYAQGADFADAMDLAVCGTSVMHTFDGGFCQAACQSGSAPAVQVWKV